jgi:hypothetical protein
VRGEPQYKAIYLGFLELRKLPMELRPTVKSIFEQLNRMLSEKVAQGNIIDHNLEKGLGTERAIRSLLEDFLPAKYGVAKGKVVNFAGGMSRQCDVIIYDRLNCPKLFIDENENQILPIEGVYAVIEVKTSLTKHTLTEAFENLNSVYNLQPERPVRSSNPKLDYRPPDLVVLGFQGLRLPTLEKHYKMLNEAYKVRASFSAYSAKSPGSKMLTGDKYLVHSIVRLDEGEVSHGFNGKLIKHAWGEYTLGIFLTKLLNDIDSMPCTEMNIFDYFNYHMIEEPDFFEGSATIASKVTGECSLCGERHSRLLRQVSNWRTSSYEIK